MKWFSSLFKYHLPVDVLRCSWIQSCKKLITCIWKCYLYFGFFFFWKGVLSLVWLTPWPYTLDVFFANGKYYTAQRGGSVSILTDQDEISTERDDALWYAKFFFSFFFHINLKMKGKNSLMLLLPLIYLTIINVSVIMKILFYSY